MSPKGLKGPGRGLYRSHLTRLSLTSFGGQVDQFQTCPPTLMATFKMNFLKRRRRRTSFPSGTNIFIGEDLIVKAMDYRKAHLSRNILRFIYSSSYIWSIVVQGPLRARCNFKYQKWPKRKNIDPHCSSWTDDGKVNQSQPFLLAQLLQCGSIFST